MKNLIIFILCIFTPVTVFAYNLHELFNNSKNSVISIEAIDEANNTIGFGTGFYVEHENKVVTNFHVIKGATKLKLAVDGESEIISELLDYDRHKDLAIISTNISRNPLLLASHKPKIGDKVITIGNPQGFELTLSEGIVSGLRKKDGTTFIQTTTPISPGSSGGPLISESGEVVGLTSFYMINSQNVNFAIAANEIKPLLESDKIIPISSVSNPVNYNNASSVAKAFFYSLSIGSIDDALCLIHSDDRESFRSYLMGGSPLNIPTYIEVTAEKTHDINGFPHAEAQLVGTKIGIDLIENDGRWWIIK